MIPNSDQYVLRFKNKRHINILIHGIFTLGLKIDLFSRMRTIIPMATIIRLDTIPHLLLLLI